MPNSLQLTQASWLGGLCTDMSLGQDLGVFLQVKKMSCLLVCDFSEMVLQIRMRGYGYLKLLLIFFN